MRTNIHFSYRAHSFLEGEMFKKKCSNQNTHFTLNNLFQNSAVYEVTWKNAVEQGRPQLTIRRMPIA